MAMVWQEEQFKSTSGAVWVKCRPNLSRPSGCLGHGLFCQNQPYWFNSTDLNHIPPCFALSRADGDFSTIARYNTSQYASVFCCDKKRSLPICWFHLAVHAWQLYKRDDSAIGKRGTTADQWGSPEPVVKSHRMNHLCRIKREPNDTPLPTNENKERTQDGASPVTPSCVLMPVCKQQIKMPAGREGADKTTQTAARQSKGALQCILIVSVMNMYFFLIRVLLVTYLPRVRGGKLPKIIQSKKTYLTLKHDLDWPVRVENIYSVKITEIKIHCYKFIHVENRRIQKRQQV